MAKIKGMASVVSKLKRLRKDTEDAMQKGITKTAKLIEMDAKAKAPTGKTSALKNSIGMETLDKRTFVFADVRYAPYVEFGTGTRTEAPIGYEDYALEFKITGEGHTGPQPFLFPAFFKHQEKLLPNVEEELKKLADKW